MLFIGIDIGGTKCAVTLGNETGEILKKIRLQQKTFFQIKKEDKNEE